MSDARFTLTRNRWQSTERRAEWRAVIRQRSAEPVSTRHLVGPYSPESMAEILRRDFQIAKLERDLKRYKADASIVATDYLSRLIALTTRLFGEDVGISESFDPEFPSDKSIVFSVETRLAPQQIVRAEQEWIRGVSEIVSNWESIRLLILPAE